MGLFTWMFRLLGWGGSVRASQMSAAEVDPDSATQPAAEGQSSNSQPKQRLENVSRRQRIRLTATRRIVARKQTLRSNGISSEVSGRLPYRFARFGSRTGCYLDLSQDGNDSRLRQRGLPSFSTPEQLANWLEIPMNKLAWLVHRFSAGRPTTVAKAHYHFTWVKKRSGGSRLIESPKQTLKQVQSRILREILDKLPPHLGQAVLVKLDLANFYASVGFARVVAIFRAIGYSREAAIWLGLLTTSAVPGNMPFAGPSPYSLLPYLRRHLPQGAPTSPALANLSAFRLDLRLSGLAKSFGAQFTRYADDLALSGPPELARGLRVLVPLVQQIIRKERFKFNRSKRRILRSHQRQTIAGVVVNEKPNIARADYDRLKAILTNCVRLGPSTQNRSSVDDFTAHLRGRIAHVSQLNPQRGQKLLTLFQKIDWRR